MALEVFSSIRYYLKPEEISIDNWVFKLHYRVSTAIMLGSSAIGVAKQYFGDPINCQVTEFTPNKLFLSVSNSPPYTCQTFITQTKNFLSFLQKKGRRGKNF